MERRRFLALLWGNLGCLLLPGCGADPGAQPQETSPAPPASTEASGARDNSEVQAFEAQNRALMEAAARREQAQAQRARALSRKPEIRKQLQYLKGQGWADFINAHLQTFLKLRAEAQRCRQGSVPCTICDGRGSLSFCVVCDNTGKCTVCEGQGKLIDGSLCPSCEGKGRCFLCHGSGKMTDPFCDDGRVYAQTPVPPRQIPIG